MQRDATTLFTQIANDKEYVGLRINDNYGLNIILQDGTIVSRYKNSLQNHTCVDDIWARKARSAFGQWPVISIEQFDVVKYFNPAGSGTWLITEAEKQEDGDWLLFGYCHIFCWEWGYVSLRELQSVKLPLGLTVERDLYIPKDATVKELIA